MSSNTDFYLGRGTDADWLGALRGECDPDTFLALPPSRLALTATDEHAYRAAVTLTLDVWHDERLGHAYRPEHGWPWPWPTSHTNDWILTFDPTDAAVFVTVGGGIRWYRLDPHHPRFPSGGDALGPPDIGAWLRDPAAPPSVPLPRLRPALTDQPTASGDAP